MLLIILGWSTAALRVDHLTYRMVIIYLNDKIGRFFGKISSNYPFNSFSIGQLIRSYRRCASKNKSF